MRRIELLCPAKNLETAKSAILCGADAVYIGASAFGARYAAANDVEEIAELCNFAHLYGCRICVALNTILDDNEILQAAELAKKLCDVGVDALIVQDLGLLEYGLPQIPIQASTQCHTTSPEKAKFLEACGFDTIVLARELSLAEIENISKELSPTTKLECFVHGALCVSYSGQCRLSYAVGGRSGNRGECAQPCRIKYELLDTNGKQIVPPAHFLSLRDMNRSKSVGEMLDAGIDIFKIEGRLKDENYVKNTAAFYRKILDKEITERGLARSSYGESKVLFEPLAEKTFSRRFCEYHLHGTQSECSSFETPKARGEFIGKAQKVFQGGFIFKNAEKIFANGDGLLFELNGKSQGGAVQKIDGDKVYVGRPEDKIQIIENSNIFRNKDVRFENLLSQKCERKMSVKISVKETENQLCFKVKTLDDRSVETQLFVEKPAPANNDLSAKETLIKNLAKLGETPFKADEIEINILRMPFFRVAEINAIRRKIVEHLKNEILKTYSEKQLAFKARSPNFAFKPSEEIECDSSANVYNKYAENFYSKFGIKISEFAAENFPMSKLRGKRVMTTKHCILRELGLCKKLNGKKFKEPFYLKNGDTTLQLHFDCIRCGMDIYFQ